MRVIHAGGPGRRPSSRVRWARGLSAGARKGGCCCSVGEDVELAAVEDLEAHQVEVHGVDVLGEIDELPDLGGVEAG